MSIATIQTKDQTLQHRVLEAIKGNTGAFVLNGNDFETEDGTCIRDYLHVTDIATEAAKNSSDFLLDRLSLFTVKGISATGGFVFDFDSSVHDDIMKNKVKQAIGGDAQTNWKQRPKRRNFST